MKILAILPAMALAACASTGSGQTGSATMPVASDFNSVAVASATFDSPLAAAQYYARYEPEEDGGGTFDLVSRRATSSGAFEMVFSAEGYADDSVDGEQWRIVVTRGNGGWRVIEAGRRFKCYRGATPGAWQKGLCP